MSDPPSSEEPGDSAPDSFDALLREAVRVSDATGPSTVQLRPGEQLCDGRFEVVRLLGAGGMGVVFEAIDHQLRERVAIKLLQARGTGAFHATRAEFLTLHDLAHPNLVRLGELLQDGQRWLYSMELIHGQDFLATVRPAGVLDEARLRDALRQLALGLIALHDAGVIHRDLKPSNVLIDGAGRLVLLDFGLAQSTDSTARTGGTAAYMPPEQAAGQPVGPAADCFAVGTMLFEALTGTLPFEVGSAREAIRTKRAGLGRRTLEGVPHPDLATLAAALLAPDPDERPDARALAARVGAEGAADREDDPPFVGRDEHLEALHRAFADRRQGWVTVHVHGESGIGKSAILERFAAASRTRGALVLQGRCHERVSIPYKTLHDVAHGLAQYLQARSDAAALMSQDLPQLAAMFPVLAGMATDLPAPTIADPQQQRAAAFRGFARLLSALAETTPLVLIIDDLQWADDDGLQLLEYLARHASRAPLLLVIGSRSALDERTPLLAGSARDLSVGPLAREEATALAAALAGDEIAGALAQRAHGHPLYLAELARVWVRDEVGDEAPQLIEAVARRFRALPAAEASLLGLACVAGEPVPQHILQRASPDEGRIFDATLAALRAGRWLRTAGPRRDDAVEPYHAVVRGAVTNLLDEETRLACHERLACELRDSGLGELRPELLL
ncbi:MAG TPA: serine/threonine-protein kinase, partial [Kofleriaceae bacterium]|nr:serine/threonine-protein kinase [Kofleriaceae bacterium]